MGPIKSSQRMVAISLDDTSPLVAGNLPVFFFFFFFSQFMSTRGSVLLSSLCVHMDFIEGVNQPSKCTGTNTSDNMQQDIKSRGKGREGEGEVERERERD